MNHVLTVLQLIIYLRKVSVSNLTFIAFLSSEGVVAHAASGVDVTLRGHRADCTATTLLQAPRQSITVNDLNVKKLNLTQTLNIKQGYLQQEQSNFSPCSLKPTAFTIVKVVFSRRKMECIQIRVLLAVSGVT